MAFFDDIITLALAQCTTSLSQRAILVLRAIFGNMVLKYLNFETTCYISDVDFNTHVLFYGDKSTLSLAHQI